MQRRIVLTGGPCGGKTTCLEALKRALGDRVVLVPEASTMVLESGFSPPAEGSDFGEIELWRREFQDAVLSTQRHLEETWARLARHSGRSLMICDRGFLDGAAYWPGGRNAFLDHFGIELDSVMARYDLVLHLESVAVSRPLLYGRANNGIRYEDVEGARRVESRVIEAWAGHPARIHVPAMETVEDRVAVLLRELRRSDIDI